MSHSMLGILIGSTIIGVFNPHVAVYLIATAATYKIAETLAGLLEA